MKDWQHIEEMKERVLHELAWQSNSNVVLRGRSWHPNPSKEEKRRNQKSVSDMKRRVKYQAGLTLEEAAMVEALRSVLCPHYSRYAFVRLLILSFCEVAQKKIKDYEKDCCWV